MDGMNNPLQHDIEIKQGQKEIINISILDDDDNNFDFSEFTAESTIREFPEDYVDYPFVCTTSQSGINLTISAENTSKMDFTNGVWDLFVINKNLDRSKLLQGNVTVQKAVSRES